MSTMTDTNTDELREQAIARLRARSEFWTHLAAYALFNGALVLVWFVISGRGLFWPMFPMLAWGIGLVFHGWDTFRRPFNEERIRREMERLGG